MEKVLLLTFPCLGDKVKYRKKTTEGEEQFS